MDNLFKYVKKQQQCEKNILSNTQTVFSILNSEKIDEQMNKQQDNFILVYYKQRQAQVREFNRITDELISDVYKYRNYNYLMQNQYDKIMQSITMCKTITQQNQSINSIQPDVLEISEKLEQLEQDFHINRKLQDLSGSKEHIQSDQSKNSQQNQEQNNSYDMFASLCQKNINSLNLKSLKNNPPTNNCQFPILKEVSPNSFSEIQLQQDYSLEQSDKAILNETKIQQENNKKDFIENEEKQFKVSDELKNSNQNKPETSCLEIFNSCDIKKKQIKNSQQNANEINDTLIIKTKNSKEHLTQENHKQNLQDVNSNYYDESRKNQACCKILSDKKTISEYDENKNQNCGKVKNQISKIVKNNKSINTYKQNKMKQKRSQEVVLDQNFSLGNINKNNNLELNKDFNDIENNNNKKQVRLNQNCDQKFRLSKSQSLYEGNDYNKIQLDNNNKLEKSHSNEDKNNIQENFRQDIIGGLTQNQTFDIQNEINKMDIEDDQTSQEFLKNLDINDSKDQQQDNLQSSCTQSLIFNDFQCSLTQNNNNIDSQQYQINKYLDNQTSNKIIDIIQEKQQLLEGQKEQDSQDFDSSLTQLNLINQDVQVKKKLKQELINEDKQKQQLNEEEQRNLNLMQSNEQEQESTKKQQQVQIKQQQEHNEEQSDKQENQNQKNFEFDETSQQYNKEEHILQIKDQQQQDLYQFKQDNIDSKQLDNLTDMQIDFKQQNIHQFESICQENQQLDTVEELQMNQNEQQQQLNLQLDDEFQCDENSQYFKQQKYYNVIKSSDNFDFNENYSPNYKINSNFSQDYYILQIKQEPIQYNQQDHLQIQSIQHHQQNFISIENQNIIIQEFDVNNENISIQQKQLMQIQDEYGIQQEIQSLQQKKQFQDELLQEQKQLDGTKASVNSKEERNISEYEFFKRGMDKQKIQEQNSQLKTTEINDFSKFKDVQQNRSEQQLKLNSQNSQSSPKLLSKKSSKINKKNENSNDQQPDSIEKQKKKTNPGRSFKELKDEEIEILRQCDRKDTSNLAKKFGMNYQTMRKAIIKIQQKK